MAGLLAVPVGVLLFVIVLALMGRRWVSPVALADAPFEDDFYEQTPYAEPWGYYEPPRAPAPMPPTYDHGPAQQWPALPPAPQPRTALPPAPRPQTALPPAPPPQPYGRQPALPPGESPLALPRGENPLALPPARPAYPSHPPESYRRPERDEYGRPYEHDPYEHDPYGRPARPEQDDSSRGAFPYGPYRQR